MKIQDLLGERKIMFHSPGGVPAPPVAAGRRTRPSIAKAAEGPFTRHTAACHAPAGGEHCGTL